VSFPAPSTYLNMCVLNRFVLLGIDCVTRCHVWTKESQFQCCIFTCALMMLSDSQVVNAVDEIVGPAGRSA